MRAQRDSPTLHAEIAALEDAGRQPASVYRDCTLVRIEHVHQLSEPLTHFSLIDVLQPPLPSIPLSGK
jgi:hypothetical protein